MKDVQGALRHSRTATTHRYLYAGDFRERPGNGEFHQHGVEKVASWDEFSGDAKARGYDCYFSREAVTESCGSGRSHSKYDTKLEGASF